MKDFNVLLSVVGIAADGVVIMTNSDNGSFLEEIANSVASVYKWKDYYLPEIKKVVEIDESLAAGYSENMILTVQM